MRALLKASTILLVVNLAPTVHAQVGSAAEGMFNRDRNISVQQRSRPEYQVEPHQSGALLLSPVLDLGLEYNDNIYATNSNEENDFIGTFAPALNVATTWSRHALNADLGVRRSEYFDNSDESVWAYNASLLGRLDIVRDTFLDASFAFNDATEPRTSAGAAGRSADPIEYDTTLYGVGFERTVNRFKARADAERTVYDYQDGVLNSGAPIDQDFRDHDRTRFTLRGDYAYTPDTAFFVRAVWNERDYDLAPPQVALLRDSDGYTLDVGADFDLGGTARGAIAVGYMRQDYKSSSFSSIDGVSIDGILEWFPTQLTTLTLTASRSIEDSAIANSGGYLATSISGRIDHELRRNILLNGQLSIGSDDYKGVDRKDERFSVSVGSSYLINRHLRLNADLSHFKQDSKGVDGNQDYDVNKVTFGLAVQF